MRQPSSVTWSRRRSGYLTRSVIESSHREQQDKLERVGSRRHEKASLMRAYLDQVRGDLPAAEKPRRLGRNVCEKAGPGFAG